MTIDPQWCGLVGDQLLIEDATKRVRIGLSIYRCTYLVGKLALYVKSKRDAANEQLKSMAEHISE